MTKVVYSEQVLQLMASTDEVVTAKVLAPIVKMHPQEIINQVRTGEWNRCEFMFSGRRKKRVKFFRVDFLRKGGWIQ